MENKIEGFEKSNGKVKSIGFWVVKIVIGLS